MGYSHNSAEILPYESRPQTTSLHSTNAFVTVLLSIFFIKGAKTGGSHDVVLKCSMTVFYQRLFTCALPRATVAQMPQNMTTTTTAAHRRPTHTLPSTSLRETPNVRSECTNPNKTNLVSPK